MNKSSTKNAKLSLNNELVGTQIAIYKNGALALKLKQEFPNIELVNADIADEAFDYLQQNRIDAYLGKRTCGGLSH